MATRARRFGHWLLLANAAVSAGMLGSVFAATPAGESSRPLPETEAVKAAPDRVALGRMLFFDTKLSADGRISCASCHQPERAFTDGKAVAEGTASLRGTRNAPTLLDVAARSALMWDGRETRLETQAIRPFTQPREHGLTDSAELLQRIRGDPAYTSFNGQQLDLAGVGAALSAYLRTLSAGDSAYDAFVAGDASALSEPARRGYALFHGPAGCAECHRLDAGRATFTDQSFHRVGVGLPAIAGRLPELTARVAASSAAQIDALVFDERDIAALGRFLVTRDPRDIGAYRTPSLRNVAVTSPYMHDGSVATLAEAVNLETYYRMHERGRPVALSVNDQADLVEFLKSLTDAQYTAADGARRTTGTAATAGR